jgi:tRNA(Ile)-lysidine synthase TilS/MesJ
MIIVKDRILETCKENMLSYVEDPTNFQPEITLRNAIRHKVRWDKEQHTLVEERFPQEVIQGLKSIQDAAKEAKLNFSLDTCPELLRQQSAHFFSLVREQEAEGKRMY